MPSDKPHLNLQGFSLSEAFRSRRVGRSTEIPTRNRVEHGTALSGQYSQILERYTERRAIVEEPISEETGIYIEITSFSDIQLPLDRLDNRDFELRSLIRNAEGVESALVFIPENKRNSFQSKLEKYLNPERDSTNGLPGNHELIDSIATLRLANIRSFWTDAAENYPKDETEPVWWELWLAPQGIDDPADLAASLAGRIGANLANTSQKFFNSFVVLIRASVTQLERSLDLISSLQELRHPKEVPNVFLSFDPQEQEEWAVDLASRTTVNEQTRTAICILDSGVNFNHPILATFCSNSAAEVWHPAWEKYDEYNPPAPYCDHGSLQAGLAAYGNVQSVVLSMEPIELTHIVESGRILPPVGNNDPELYGAVTVGTAAKLEGQRPDFQRVYSLAVTASPEALGGQPSSWSAEIDLTTSGVMDGLQRLYVISAGNNRVLLPEPEYWEQIHLAEAEDPSQAWNALTVGAYTELHDIDDSTFVGWTPIAAPGDASPETSTSVNWGWKKHAPIKPDIVAEGGNWLMSPLGTEVSDAETVSLLTTSGRTNGQLFKSHSGTSPATAFVSHQAAYLMASYPHYWPETIRGLLVHSADWTERMFERFGNLLKQHSPKVAKETMLRTVGYGVTDITRARYSAENELTMIAQEEIQPYTKREGATASTDPKLNEMRLHELPWPTEVLQQLPPELEVTLRITLSYFIEPNPSRRGYRQRYSYQSHGLRFEVIRPGQQIENFRSYINALSTDDDYIGPEGDTQGWRFGSQLRTRGSLHSDIWTGSAADLAMMGTIAVYPVGGWWKYRTSLDRWERNVRYSLLVSIEVPDEEVDIYSVIETEVMTQIAVEV